MKKNILLTVCFFNFIFANPGLWSPQELPDFKILELKKMGLELEKNQIYHEELGLNQAIVQFNGNCSGALISNNGLLITNYHCVKEFLKFKTPTEIEQGFWANNFSAETPIPNLFVQFVRAIETVTPQVLAGTADLQEVEKKKKIQNNISKIIQEKKDFLKKDSKSYQVDVVATDYGNTYFLYLSETFSDVRWVGAPAASLAEFGGDIDNWEWPRQVADFALFRIYVNEKNEASPYKNTNQPYKSTHFLKVNPKGVNVSDFVWVYGFPGQTLQHLTQAQLAYFMQKELPKTQKMRQKVLEILAQYPEEIESPEQFYTVKKSEIANEWKKNKGIEEGVRSNNLLMLKKSEETEILLTAHQKSPKESARINDILQNIQALYLQTDVLLANEQMNLFLEIGSDFLQWLDFLKQQESQLKTLKTPEWEKIKIEWLKKANYFYSNFNQEIDQKIFETLLNFLFIQISLPIFQKELGHFSKLSLMSERFYGSDLVTEKGFQNLLKKAKIPADFYKMLNQRESMRFYQAFKNVSENIKKDLNFLQENEEILMRDWVAYKTQYSEKKYAPEANGTLRISYGNVKNMRKDGVEYRAYTTLDGLLEKYFPGSVYELPALFTEVDFFKKSSKYIDKEGKLRLCFLTSSQTSSGNSGSAVLDGRGRLVGLNFDRTYLSTVSDYAYFPDFMRNIAVDVRYILFVLDEVSGANNLMQELVFD